MNLLSALRAGPSVFAAELRPPRAELATAEGMDAWIDTYHAVRRLTRQGTFVFLTDSAVGAAEEDNLRHLVTNLGLDVPRDRIVPFLTTKHAIEYCLSYADRAHQGGFLALGGWANPHADPERQVDYLVAEHAHAEFFLTQVVSHHHADQITRFVRTAERRGLAIPGLFGVFYYRSANPRTLDALKGFLPVPAEGLTREFGDGATAEEICAKTIRSLLDAGAKHFYISNLPVLRAQPVLAAILEKVGVNA